MYDDILGPIEKEKEEKPNPYYRCISCNRKILKGFKCPHCNSKSSTVDGGSPPKFHETVQKVIDESIARVYRKKMKEVYENV